MKEFAILSDADTHALLAVARALHADPSRHVLRGKNLAQLLCDDDLGGAGAQLFHRAASSLGAHVAALRPRLTEDSAPEQIRHLANMLGRLYDGLDCVGLPTDLVRRIGEAAGVPVFEAISSSAHPTSRLADQLGDRGSADDRRCAVMQAVLLSVLA